MYFIKPAELEAGENSCQKLTRGIASYTEFDRRVFNMRERPSICPPGDVLCFCISKVRLERQTSHVPNLELIIENNQEPMTRSVQLHTRPMSRRFYRPVYF